MFKKIKEFIKAFNDAYNTINVNKFAAKNAIEDYRKEVEEFSNVAKTMNDLYDNLVDAYEYFPIKERYDFVKKTRELLVYGRKDSHGCFIDICGWRALWRSQADGANLHLEWLNEYYKAGKYTEVISLAKEYTEKLEEFNILYGIEENTVENDE